MHITPCRAARVGCGQGLAGRAGSGSQLWAHERLLAALPGDRLLSACICCEATHVPPLQPPLAASLQAPALGSGVGMLRSGTAHGLSIPPPSLPSSVAQEQTLLSPGEMLVFS